MSQSYKDSINQAYDAFNSRTIDVVLMFMHPDVHWLNGWEGGYVKGHDEVRMYWERQWKELNPRVVPVAFREKENGEIEVQVHQLVKDLQGNVLFDGMIKHVFTFDNGLITAMKIESI